MPGFFVRRRRALLRARPFPAEWRAIIAQNVSSFARLPRVDQKELEGHIQVFLHEKHWEGCGGLELTDEIRVTISAQACMLLLRRNADYYPRVTSILVYPSSYVATEERAIGGGIWEESDEARLGHTQQQLRAVVLAWDAALHGSRLYGTGSNVVLHEFAHQLDFEDNFTDGTPLLPDHQQYVSWARVLGEEYERLRRLDDAGEPSFLDSYGATNPAEFFAVATEFFFERAAELQLRHPNLYAELKNFYRQDPAREWGM
jgi:Mlc titration factor MtfA (ptsG expression regulator)